MARVLAWLRFAGTVVAVYFSIAATHLGCAGSSNPAAQAVPHRALWWIHRHLDKIDESRLRSGHVDLLFVGDSITQDYELAGPSPERNIKPVWDDLFAPHHAMNLGFNGDETGQLLWRLRHGEVNGLTPRDIVLLIGANNLNFVGSNPRVQSSEQIAGGTMAVVEELHSRMPAAKILVLSILPSGRSAEVATKSVQINDLVKKRIQALTYARYLDVSGPFLDGIRVRAELYYDPKVNGPYAPALHPDPTGQRMMAELVANALYGH